jgi:hypothetical protein
VVVVVMSIFKRKNAKCGALILEMRGLLAKRQKEPIFRRKIPVDQEALLKKLRKGRIPKKLAHKSKKLELNCTNLMLNSKNTSSDCAKKPDPSISSLDYMSKIRQLGSYLTLGQVVTSFS